MEQECMEIVRGIQETINWIVGMTIFTWVIITAATWNVHPGQKG